MADRAYHQSKAYHVAQRIVNGYFGRSVGYDRRPTFFDIERTYPTLDLVTHAYPAIREELDGLMGDRDAFLQYHELDAGERAISGSTPKRWNVFLLEAFGRRPSRSGAACPRTRAALARVPNLIQAFFSVMEPGKTVPEHEGPYLGYLRYHLGLRVPTDAAPWMMVNGQRYLWHEGEAVLFDDSWPHSVANPSAEPRAVLIVDVLRPLPPVPALLNRFLMNVIARNTYGRELVKKADAFERAPARAEPSVLHGTETGRPTATDAHRRP